MTSDLSSLVLCLLLLRLVVKTPVFACSFITLLDYSSSSCDCLKAIADIFLAMGYLFFIIANMKYSIRK